MEHSKQIIERERQHLMDKQGKRKGAVGLDALNLFDPMFVTGPKEVGTKIKKREINMIDYEREASGMGVGL